MSYRRFRFDTLATVATKLAAPGSQPHATLATSATLRQFEPSEPQSVAKSQVSHGVSCERALETPPFVATVANVATVAEGGVSASSEAVATVAERQWSLGDWFAAFEERASVLEYDGGLERAEAERQAHEDTVAVLGPRPGAVH